MKRLSRQALLIATLAASVAAATDAHSDLSVAPEPGSARVWPSAVELPTELRLSDQDLIDELRHLMELGERFEGPSATTRESFTRLRTFSASLSRGEFDDTVAREEILPLLDALEDEFEARAAVGLVSGLLSARLDPGPYSLSLWDEVVRETNRDSALQAERARAHFYAGHQYLMSEPPAVTAALARFVMADLVAPETPRGDARAHRLRVALYPRYAERTASSLREAGALAGEFKRRPTTIQDWLDWSERHVLSQPVEAIAASSWVLENGSVGSAELAEAHVRRGQALLNLSPRAPDLALIEFDTVLDSYGTELAMTDIARAYRAGCLSQLGRAEEAIAAATAALGSKTLASRERVLALTYRGLSQTMLDPPQPELARKDYSTVVEMAEASNSERAHALWFRARLGFYGDLADYRRSVADLSKALELDDVPDRLLPHLLRWRARLSERFDPPDTATALRDYSTLIAYQRRTGASATSTLIERGDLMLESDPPNNLAAIWDYSSVLADAGCDPEQRAEAYYSRAIAFNRLGSQDDPRVLNDLRSAVEVEEASGYWRGFAAAWLADILLSQAEPEIDEVLEITTAALVWQDVPIQTVDDLRSLRAHAKALHAGDQHADSDDRSGFWSWITRELRDPSAAELLEEGKQHMVGSERNYKSAISAFSSAIETEGARPDEIAEALYRRGEAYLELEPPRERDAARDFRSAAEVTGAGSCWRTWALAHLSDLQLDSTIRSRPLEAIETATEALERFDCQSDGRKWAQLTRARAYRDLEPVPIEKVIADLTAVVDRTRRGSYYFAWSLAYRGNTYHHDDDNTRVILAYADYTSVINEAELVKQSDAEALAWALLSRAELLATHNPQNRELWLADIHAVLALEQVGDWYRAEAYLVQGRSYLNQVPVDLTAAQAAFSAVLAVANASDDQRAEAQSELMSLGAADVIDEGFGLGW